MSRLLVLAAAVVAAAGAGCANARYVSKSADEGVVAIPNNTDVWPAYNRTNAMKLIEEHVGPGYQIVDEKAVQVGMSVTNQQDTKRQMMTNPNKPFMATEKDTTTTTTTAQDLTEWQIHYRKAVGGPTGFPNGGITQTGGFAPTGGAAGGEGVMQAGGLTPPPMTVAPGAAGAAGGVMSPGLPPPMLPTSAGGFGSGR